MQHHTFKLRPIAVAVSLSLLTLGSAWAQTAENAPLDTNKDAMKFDQIVVTGTASRVTKMKSSVSVSTLDSDQIQMTAPTTSAEVLRAIPGVHSESSGGEGNTNLTIRGLPISAGGSRYVQWAEDGLPVLQSGDYNFVTPDMFLKVDNSLDRVEVVRGGSASVLGSNSPGGILNFITKTGDVEGGSVGISKGTGNQTRYDVDYGGPLSDKTRFFIGGFYRTGDGPRNGGIRNAEDGGQIKGNITHELGDGNFIRASFKHLDDKTPLSMPVPVSLSNTTLGNSPSKANPSTIVANPAYDLLNASFYSPYWTGIVKRVKGNGLATKDANEGLVVKEDSFGFEGSFKLGGGVTLTDNFRKSTRSGNFAAAFPTGEVFAANPGTIIASGPNAGKAYTGNALRVSAFNTSFDDLGNTVNALKLSKTFDMADAGKLTALVGWDTNNQTVSTTWALPHYLISATGDQPVMLNGTQGGQQTDATGQFPGGGWGGQAHNVKYDMSSPYLSLAYEVGPLNLDGGIRQDNQKVQGYVDQASSTTTYAPGTFNATPTTPVNYDKSRTSYSLGGNYRINKDLAAFARYSDGAVFSVLGRGSSTAYDGSQPIDLYTVKQSELGVKWRREGLSVFATYFQAETYESNYTLTTQTTSSTGYKSRGLEIEAAYRSEGFHVNGGITYTQAEIIYEGAMPLNPTTIGNVPHRLPKYQYQITPSYDFGGLTIGGSVIGQTEAFSGDNDANDAIQDGFYVVNLFGSYQIDKHTSVYLSANNLFNKVGITEAQYPNGTEARSINGRTAKIGVKYTF